MAAADEIEAMRMQGQRGDGILVLAQSATQLAGERVPNANGCILAGADQGRSQWRERQRQTPLVWPVSVQRAASSEMSHSFTVLSSLAACQEAGGENARRTPCRHGPAACGARSAVRGPRS